MKLRYFPLAFVFLVTLLHSIAQDDPPAPEFLLRQDDQLLLINGYTGETTTLPIDLSESDRVEWSPNGAYIIVEYFIEDNFLRCINIFDVDVDDAEWISGEPISCELNRRELLITEDDSQMLYITTDTENDALWLYDIATQTNQKLFETTEGDEAYNDGLARLEWSLSEKYVTFDQYESIMGGARNSLIVMDMNTYDHFLVQAPRLYYANYDPIWSVDDKWFLIMMKDVYQISSTISAPEQKGDVYLVNAQTGEQVRITYTPAVEELDIHWTDDGQITFTEVIMNDVTMTLDEAQNIEPVLPEDIVQPEEEPFPPLNPLWITYSPDPIISAWYGSVTSEDGSSRSYTIMIGTFLPENIVFTATSPEQLPSDAVTIGWRPTDFVYSQE